MSNHGRSRLLLTLGRRFESYRGRGVYALTLRYGGQRIHRSLKTTSAKRAAQLKATVELTLEKPEQGHLTVPSQLTAGQLWRFLLSGGQADARLVVTDDVTLVEVCRRYVASYSRGTKDDATLSTEQRHLNHFQRLLGAEASLTELTADDLRRYVLAREAEPGIHGRTIAAATIKKELQTFHQIGNFARGEGLVTGDSPRQRVRTPRESQKPRFMTR